MNRDNIMLRTLCLIFAAMLLSVAGCGENPVSAFPGQDAVDLDAQITEPLASSQDKSSFILEPHEIMEHFQRSLEVEYHNFEALYFPGNDVIIGGPIPSWPEGYSVGLIIPADALPLEHDPVNISIRVPRYIRDLPDDEQPPLVLILDFDGVVFENPVEVFVPNAPWLEVDDDVEEGEEETIFHVFSMDPFYENNVLRSVGYSNLQHVNREVYDNPAHPLFFGVTDEGRTELVYEVPGDQSDLEASNSTETCDQ